MYKVYKITNKVNNKYYIGMTNQKLEKRFSQHKQNAKKGKVTYLYNAIRKYGSDNFIIELLSEYNSKEDCCKAEINFISENKNGYNLALGGEGGFVVQDIGSWKDKLKEARKGKTPALGLKHSEETKEKCAKASKEYWDSQDTYDWENIKNYSYKEAKEKFGISTTHYYRLKNKMEKKPLVDQKLLKRVGKIKNLINNLRITNLSKYKWKPSGNASVVLGTASGIHPEHSEKYFRIMQLNKENESAKWLEENMPFLLEESIWSSTGSDYVVFIPIENPSVGLFKKDMKGIKHLELIKLVQKHWVNNGTNKELCLYPNVNHNTSNTVIIDNKEEVVNYIWNNKEDFTAVSFISDYGDKDFNQAPFTSVSTVEEIVNTYGKGALFVSGLIVDGLHYFNNDLWTACDMIVNPDIKISGTKEQVMLKKYWLSRTKKFANNFFNGDMQKMIYCLKDIHLLHKWEVINRDFKPVDFGKILSKPRFKDIGDFSAQACSGGACEITSIN